jgi:hypothetical protein
MKQKILEKVYQHLNLDLEENTINQSINLGEFKVIDNDKVLINIMDKYYNHILSLYKENEKLTKAYSKAFEYDSFIYKSSELIKTKFFPTYQQYCQIFRAGYLRDQLFDQLKFIPYFDDEINRFKQHRKDTVEDYKKFIKQYSSINIKKRISEPIPLYINHKYTEKSVYISGKSGSGKTEILKNMIMSNIEQNNSSLIILDIHGDYSLQIAKLIKDKSRLIYIDLFDGDDENMMPSLNPFEISDRTDETLISLATQNISNTIKAIIGSEFSIVMEALLAPMLNTLLRIEGSSLYDLYKFCDDDLNKELVEYGIKHCDPMNAHYLKYDFYNADKRTKKALKTRLQLLLNHEKFAQFLTGKSTFNLQEAMDTNKIIIFRFNKVKLRETMSPIGRFIVSSIQTYAMLRASINENIRPKTFMYIDEFQNFVNETIDEILSESRKFTLYLILAHQFISQLENTRIRESILSNTKIKITGMNAYTHNQAMSKQFRVKTEELEQLKDVGEFYFRKDNDTAFKFKSSTKFIDIKFTHTQIHKWEKELKNQLNSYYAKVEKKDSLFITLPNEKKEESKKNKHYSKDIKENLIDNLVLDQGENELLDF